MYSTCTFCHRSLGTNPAIAAFPVGKRIAFDASNGRLWVVCPHCAQWNLSPLDERWEAIDCAEGLFRGAKMRHSSDNIGLARLSDGTELVRIGTPLQDEFAAWRYGQTFANRRRRIITSIATGTVVLGAGALVLPSASLVAGLFAGLVAVGSVVAQVSENGGGAAAFSDRMIRGNDGKLLRVTQDNVPHVRVVGDPSGWALNVPHRVPLSPGPDAWTSLGETHTAVITGDAALAAARQMLPLVNGFGARKSVVSEAVSTASSWKNVSEGFAYSLMHVREWSAQQQFGATGALTFLPAPVRLALEMSMHQDEERRALDGDLSALKQSWIEAELIAAIADNLLLPGSVEGALAKLHKRSANGDH